MKTFKQIYTLAIFILIGSFAIFASGPFSTATSATPNLILQEVPDSCKASAYGSDGYFSYACILNAGNSVINMNGTSGTARLTESSSRVNFGKANPWRKAGANGWKVLGVGPIASKSNGTTGAAGSQTTSIPEGGALLMADNVIHNLADNGVSSFIFHPFNGRNNSWDRSSLAAELDGFAANEDYFSAAESAVFFPRRLEGVCNSGSCTGNRGLATTTLNHLIYPISYGDTAIQNYYNYYPPPYFDVQAGVSAAASYWTRSPVNNYGYGAVYITSNGDNRNNWNVQMYGAVLPLTTLDFSKILLSERSDLHVSDGTEQGGKVAVGSYSGDIEGDTKLVTVDSSLLSETAFYNQYGEVIDSSSVFYVGDDPKPQPIKMSSVGSYSAIAYKLIDRDTGLVLNAGRSSNTTAIDAADKTIEVIPRYDFYNCDDVSAAAVGIEKCGDVLPQSREYDLYIWPQVNVSDSSDLAAAPLEFTAKTQDDPNHPPAPAPTPEPAPAPNPNTGGSGYPDTGANFDFFLALFIMLAAAGVYTFRRASRCNPRA